MLILILAFLWAQARGSQREERSGGQLPGRPAPGEGGQATQRLPSADSRGQLPPVEPEHRHSAEAAQRRLPRPQLAVQAEPFIA
jgi:hypothetical protein